MIDSIVKTILVCDTQPVAVEGVRGLLARSQGLRFAGAVCSLEAAFELVRSITPAAVVLDKALGTPAIMDWLHRLTVSGIATAAVVWGTGINEAEALKLLQAGARGVLRRTSDPASACRGIGRTHRTNISRCPAFTVGRAPPRRSSRNSRHRDHRDHSAHWHGGSMLWYYGPSR